MTDFNYEVDKSLNVLRITHQVPNNLYQKFISNEKLAPQIKELGIEEFETDTYQIDLRDMTVSKNGNFHGNYRRQIPTPHSDFDLTCLCSHVSPKFDEIRYICYATALFYDIEPIVGYTKALEILNNQLVINQLCKTLNVKEVHYPRIINQGDTRGEEPKKLWLPGSTIGYLTSNGMIGVNVNQSDIVELASIIAKQMYTYLVKKKSEIREREKQSVEAIPYIYSLIVEFYYSYLLIHTQMTGYNICSYVDEPNLYDIQRAIKNSLNAPQTLALSKQ